MAGDWMMIDLELADKPEVHQIAAILGIDPDSVVGKLVRVWSWFDKQTVDGHAPSVTDLVLDRITARDGFAKAMREARWLDAENGGLAMPRFDRWNGQSAKKRALANRRQAKKRTANVTPTSRIERDKNVTREEKRRSNTPVVPLNLPAGVEMQDWQAFRDHRSANRKKLTPRAEELALAKLHHLAAQGFDPKRLLNHAIEAGWATFYEREECRAALPAPGVPAGIGKCPCGSAATVKVGGQPRCNAHVRGLEVAA